MAKPIRIAKVGPDSIQKATGPRSTGGKERSSRNAIKHGIFSDVVLPSESREKYQSLVSGLWETLHPAGRLEELLVEKLATVVWRHRRLLAAEGAEIRNSTEFLEWDKENRKRQEVVEESRVDPDEVFQSDLALIVKIQDPEQLDACLELLQGLREEIKSAGFDRERDTETLEKIYGPATEFRRTLLESYLAWVGTAEGSEEEFAIPQQCKESVLIEMDNEIRRLRQYQRRYAAVESERGKLEVLRRNIPEASGMDRLLRYEASLERSFDRTLNQLERMQRLRRGQPVAPRLEVNVTS